MVKDYISGLANVIREGWTAFWFTPRAPHTLALMRIAAGAMIFYTHLVWSIDFLDFFGSDARITRQFTQLYHESAFAWSHFHWVESSTLLVVIHLLGLGIVLAFTLGLFTKVTSVLTFLLTVSYIHRVPGALFGLDQINSMLAMYLMLSGCGAVYSLDAWRRHRQQAWQGRGDTQEPSGDRLVMNNVATRLIQLHMCVIYFFAATGKLQGTSWWDGTAMWLSFANYEYQSLDMTWLADHPLLVNFMTHAALVWELTYSALVWPRWTRPLVIILAVPVHLGIVIALGMITFGLIMLVGNAAFVSPQLAESAVARIFGRRPS